MVIMMMSFFTKQQCCCADVYFCTAAVLLCGDDTRPNTRSRRKSDVTTACLHVEAPASIRDARRTGRRLQRERCYLQPPSARAQIRALPTRGVRSFFT